MRLAIGGGYEMNDLVFPKVDGSMWPPTSFDWHRGRVVVKAGTGGVRFHDLRHTHAPAPRRSGSNVKVVAGRLGHASACITLEPCAHVLPDMRADAAARVDERVQDSIDNAWKQDVCIWFADAR